MVTEGKVEYFNFFHSIIISTYLSVTHIVHTSSHYKRLNMKYNIISHSNLQCIYVRGNQFKISVLHDLKKHTHIYIN